MDSEAIQRDGTSLTILFDIEESIVDNLEDFIYLARLGCIEEARAMYDECLAPYQDQFFPILAEHAAMFFEIGDYAKVQELLSKKITSSYPDSHQELLKSMVSAAKEMTRSKSSGFYSLIQIYSSYAPLLQNILERRKERNLRESIYKKFHALIDTVYRATPKFFPAIKFQSLTMQIFCLAASHPYEVYRYLEKYHEELFGRLCRISRFWEAKQLIFPTLRPLERLKLFRSFFWYSKDYVTQQSTKIALLASRTECILLLSQKQPILDNVEQPIPDEMEKNLDEAGNLLRYFFDSPSDARGRLYEEWKQHSPVGLWGPSTAALEMAGVSKLDTNMTPIEFEDSS